MEYRKILYRFIYVFLSGFLFGTSVNAEEQKNILSSTETELEVGTFAIEMSPIESHRALINDFQEDCMNSINPPKNFFNRVEVQRTSTNGFYLIRLTGKIPPEEIISFSNNFFEFIDYEGKSEKLKFNPNDYKIQRDEEGQAFLSFIVPSPRTIRIGLLFRQKVDQRYDLIMQMDAAGKILKAYFRPLLDIERRRTFCPKSFSIFAMGGNLSAYQQRLDSVSGEVFSLPIGMTLEFDWQRTISLRQQQILNFEAQKKQMNLPASILNDEQIHNLNQFQFQYLWSFQEDNLKRFRRSMIIAPFWRFGLGLKQISLFQFDKADIVQIETNLSSMLVGGIGFNIYIGQDIMLELNSHLKTQVWGQGSFKSGTFLTGQTSLYYQPDWKWKTNFIGWTGKFYLEEINYQRSVGMDQSGTIRNLTLESQIFWGRFF